jgi:hypothetical protein
MAIPTKDGDIRADPQGFDRFAFLKQLSRDLPAFFDKAFNQLSKMREGRRPRE